MVKYTSWMLVLTVALLAVFVVGSYCLAAEGGSAEKPKEDVKPAEKEGEEEVVVLSLEERLKQLQMALSRMTARSHRIPTKIDSLARFIKEREKGLINPETGKPIIMNPKMAGQDDRSIKKPGEFLTFWADKDTPGKGRCVIYGDSKIAYLNAKDLKKAQDSSVAHRLTPEERGMLMDARKGAR